ncbi:hypothetical protein ACFX1T_041839 [Malus domestica]
MSETLPSPLLLGTDGQKGRANGGEEEQAARDCCTPPLTALLLWLRLNHLTIPRRSWEIEPLQQAHVRGRIMTTPNIERLRLIQRLKPCKR